MRNQIRKEGLNPEECSFRMVAVGPIFDEQPGLKKHKRFRDITAALERDLAQHLKDRGYKVLGNHSSLMRSDVDRLREVTNLLNSEFRPRNSA